MDSVSSKDNNEDSRRDLLRKKSRKGSTSVASATPVEEKKSSKDKAGAKPAEEKKEDKKTADKTAKGAKKEE